MLLKTYIIWIFFRCESISFNQKFFPYSLISSLKTPSFVLSHLYGIWFGISCCLSFSHPSHLLTFALRMMSSQQGIGPSDLSNFFYFLEHHLWQNWWKMSVGKLKPPFPPVPPLPRYYCKFIFPMSVNVRSFW